MQKERNINLDLIRTVAVISVISVHFFLNSGFYSLPLLGKTMYISTVFRTLFMICVPLFLLLTGYLMNKKELSKKYYGGIKKTLFVYVLSTILMLLYINYYKGAPITLTDSLKNILSYSQYSWYIAMYIGLFLLIPFLNLIYNGLKSQAQKSGLVLTLIFLTVLPTLFNTETTMVLPVWWTSLYPVMYYFSGTYICEFKDRIKLPLWLNFILILVAIFGFGAIKFTMSHGVNFIVTPEVDWHGYMTFITSILTFLFLLRLNLKKCPKILKIIISKISDLSLGIYLISWLFDDLFYEILAKRVPAFSQRLPYFFQMVFGVFICSLIISWIISLIYKIFRVFPKILPNKDNKKGVSL